MATKIALRVLAIGLFAGTLDIADVFIFNVLRGITLMLCIGLPIFVLTARYLPARDRG
jgi:hypothetical protein